MREPFTIIRVLALLGWLALTFVAAAVGAAASAEAPTFYAQLDRPSWAPPAFLFGPVWSVLYVLMAVSAWLVWSESKQPTPRTPLLLFVVQLALNALWSWIFFAWRLGSVAFFEIVVLWVLVAATFVSFVRVSRLAGALLLPYLAWVGFATVLTWAIWQRNPMLLK